MARTRVLFLTAACVLVFGVPVWQAQNSPAQDRLPQVEQSPAQQQQMQEPPAQEMPPQASQPEPMAQEPMAQEPVAQEPAGLEASAPEHDMQAEVTENGAPERSSKTAAKSYERAPKEAKRDSHKPVKKAELTNPVLWQDPGDIASKDLFWGQGGPQHQPRPPFTFIREDLHGNSAKFECRDANGKKWTVKLGPEARPEAVAGCECAHTSSG